jgi:hypothetical protein
LQILAAAGGGAFVLVSLAVGLRMLLLARRTRELPELVMGAALFLMGGVGYPAGAVAKSPAGLAEGVRGAAIAVQLLCMGVGIAGIGVFNWRVFRPSHPAARRAAAVLGVAAAASVVWQGIQPGFVAGALANEGLALRLSEFLAGCALVWAATESWLYWAKLRRRMALGMADPVVTDRIRLWGIGTTAAWLINVVAQVLAWNGVDMAAVPWGGAVIGPVGLVAAGAMALAFFPPEGYRRRVAARQPAR